MAVSRIYSSENIDISVDPDKHHVQLELSSSGYRPKYVSVFIEDAAELERVIEALQQARSAFR